MVHPTAVYETDSGDLYTLLINGKQPKSSTDLFILWQLRMMSEVIVQSGKTLRDEPKALEYSAYLQNKVGIDREEYQTAFS